VWAGLTAYAFNDINAFQYASSSRSARHFRAKLITSGALEDAPFAARRSRIALEPVSMISSRFTSTRSSNSLMYACRNSGGPVRNRSRICSAKVWMRSDVMVAVVGMELGIDPLHAVEIEVVQPRLIDELAEQLGHHAGVAEQIVVEAVMVGRERYLPRQAADVIGWRQAKKLAVNILSAWNPQCGMNP